MDAGLIVFATASNLDDDELMLLLEVCSRDSMFIVNVGKNEFRNGIVDLNLSPKDSMERNVKQVVNLISSRQVFDTEPRAGGDL